MVYFNKGKNCKKYIYLIKISTIRQAFVFLFHFTLLRNLQHSIFS